MSTWTWTFVRVDKLTKQQTEWCLNHVKWLTSGQTYAEYIKLPFKEALKKWIEMHKKNYDYFVNECDVNPEKLTDKALEKELKNKLKEFKERQELYDKCLAGELTLEEVLRKTHQLTDRGDFYVIKRQGNYYVEIQHEIFRNQKDSEDEFHTVEDLIKELKTSNLITDFSVKNSERGPLTPELEQKIRDYYGEIGDDNFYVHFG